MAQDFRGQEEEQGTERYTPHLTVPVSPQCPQEIGLLTLPPPMLQGTAVSSERFSQLPPGNVAVLGGLLPPRSLEQLDQPTPAGPPLQGTELAALSTPEVRLERPIPLVDYLAAWKLLPNVSQWVLHTVERGYIIKFKSRPPRFSRVFPTLMGPEQALVMEQEADTLLRKEAIEVVPPLERESGFYSWYFIVPMKDGGLRPILDLCQMNRSVRKLMFKMLTLKQDQVRGLVCHDRSEGRILPHFHPSSTQEVRFRGQSLPISGSSFRSDTLTPHFHKVCGCCSGSVATPGHPHTELYRRLVDTSSIGAVGGSASRCRSRPYERIGVKTKWQEKCVSPTLRITYLGIVWDSTTMQALLSPGQIESILTAVKRVREGQSLTVKQFQKLLRLMAAASNVIPFGLLYMRPLQWWLKTKGFSPKGKSTSHDQGHVAMLMYLRHVEETLVLVSGPGAGSYLLSCNANDGRAPHRLGSGHERPPILRSVERPPSHMAHQLPGDAGHVSDIETLLPGLKRPSRVGAHRQHSGGLLHQPPGRSAFTPLYRLAHQGPHL